MSSEDLNFEDLNIGSDHSSRHEDLPPDLKAIEAELARLRPREDRLGREHLAYLAGRASMARQLSTRNRVWTTACAGVTTAALVLLAVVFVQYRQPSLSPGGTTQSSTQFVEREPDRETVVASTPTDQNNLRQADEGEVAPGILLVAGRSRADRIDLWRRMLSQEADPRGQTLAAVSGDLNSSTRPLTYHRLRTDLLDSESQRRWREIQQSISPETGVDL